MVWQIRVLRKRLPKLWLWVLLFLMMEKGGNGRVVQRKRHIWAQDIPMLRRQIQC